MPRTRIKKDGPNPVDIHVGNKVKSRRLMLALSQEELAAAIGVTFQQVQKYERGINRISVSRMVDISKALKVPVDYFMDNLYSVAPAVAGAKKTPQRGVSDNKQVMLEPDPMTNRDVVALVRAFQAIKTPALKKQLLEMAKALSSQD